MEQWILGGGLIALIGLMLVNSREQDKKISRQYGRLDEVKDYQDNTFTRKDVCIVMHKQVDETLRRIENKLDKVLDGR